jgi:serine/threonine-protein kinase
MAAGDDGAGPTGPLAPSEWTLPPRPRPGARLGPFEIGERIGAGGMGEVFRARDTRLGREVAIKVLPASSANDPEALRRFEIEARAAAALSHPNILTVHEVGADGPTRYVVAELVDGAPLRGPLAPERIAEIGRQICAGLDAAHAKGIVHRDLKPGNLLVARDGAIKIVDFGVAKLLEAPAPAGLTEAGAVLGTPGYMSPEQLRGQPVDARSDLFSLGVVLYELFSGRRPFSGPSRADTATATLERDPAPLAGAPAWLQRVVDRCLEKDPARRYQSARELAFALESPTASRKLERAPGRRRRPIGAALVLVAAVALGVVAWRWPRTGAARPIRTLAVLPFEPLVAAQADAALELGMADTLIARLEGLSDLRVRPIGAVRRYAGREVDAVAAGREQRVDAVLHGSIQQAGDTVRVTVRLVTVGDERPLWTERFDTRAAGIFAVQDEIAERVVAALRLRLTGDARARLTRRPTESPEAYRLYLLGRYHLSRWTDDGFWKARDYFQQAIAADPGYALAHAGLADAYHSLSGFNVLPPNQGFPLARQAAEAALRLDDQLAEAHVALATVHLFYDWRWSEAEAEYRRALELNPGSSDAHQMYGYLLVATNRLDEAAAAMQRAHELDPLSLPKICGIGEVLLVSRRFDQAATQFRKALDMDPSFGFGYWALGRALLGQGSLDEAIAAFETSIPLSGDSPDEPAELARAQALAGRRREALAVVDDLQRRSTRRYIPPTEIATIYAALGDRDQAFAWLERARAEHDSVLVFLQVDPMFDPLRGDPRFAALAGHLAFPR